MSDPTLGPPLVGTVPAGLAHIRQVSAAAPSRYRHGIAQSGHRQERAGRRTAALADREADRSKPALTSATRCPRASRWPPARLDCPGAPLGARPSRLTCARCPRGRLAVAGRGARSWFARHSLLLPRSAPLAPGMGAKFGSEHSRIYG